MITLKSVPPFSNDDIVICIRDSPQMWLDGSEVDLCRCTVGKTYAVEFMVWSSICGWLIATPSPHKSVYQELHKAEDFKLKDIHENL